MDFKNRILQPESELRQKLRKMCTYFIITDIITYKQQRLSPQNKKQDMILSVYSA